MNGLLFHFVGPDHYAQTTGLLSWKEMRQGVVYLQCGNDDNASLEGHICFKALEEELRLALDTVSLLLNHIEIIFLPPFSSCYLALEILLFFISVFIWNHLSGDVNLEMKLSVQGIIQIGN